MKKLYSFRRVELFSLCVPIIFHFFQLELEELLAFVAIRVKVEDVKAKKGASATLEATRVPNTGRQGHDAPKGRIHRV